MAEDYKLIDNEEKHRYEFQIDGKIAEIDYIKSNNGEIYLVHTEVPASLGGKPFTKAANIRREGSRLTTCGKSIGRHRATRSTPGTALPVCSRIYSQTSGMEANCNAWYSY